MVVEEPEVPVETHVDARRLEHRRFVRVEDDAVSLELGTDIAVGEEHPDTVLGVTGRRRPVAG
ncbi:hypothetical protein GCM10023198_08700 [Promicromonospora umidemergens]|uniref:Uncharacterized protein n=1 Tax=Promicromonospora umidemergens TaxID=629679 RepID=A0ABP8WNR1_9MICO